MGFEIIDGSYPCCVDNFYTCLIKAGQKLAARLDDTFQSVDITAYFAYQILVSNDGTEFACIKAIFNRKPKL
jgi:hypothetical protein